MEKHDENIKTLFLRTANFHSIERIINENMQVRVYLKKTKQENKELKQMHKSNLN